jgi:MFS family permease
MSNGVPRPPGPDPRRRRAQGLREGLSALSVPAYRRYVVATSANNVTVWLFQTAVSWLILEQTGSAAAVGVLFLAWTLPTLVTMIPAGVLVDRIGPRRGMLVSQAITALLFVGAAALSAAGELTVERAIVVALLLGTVDGFWSAPSLAMASRVVAPHQLGSALGLSSLTFGFGRLIGGFVGGLLVAAAGATPALAVGAIGPALAFLLTLTLPAVPGLEASRVGTLRDFWDAAGWMARMPNARTLVLLGMAVALGPYAYPAIMPIVTRDLLQAGPAELGLLSAATGIGVIGGALGMDAFGRWAGRGRTIAIMVLVPSAAVALLSLSSTLALSMALAAILAGSLIVFRTTTIALLQALAPGRMRGRVLSIFEIAFWGINPIGGILGGLLADRFGTVPMLLIFGGLSASALVVALVADRALITMDLDLEARATVRGVPYVDGRPMPEPGPRPPGAGGATADQRMSATLPGLTDGP